MFRVCVCVIPENPQKYRIYKRFCIRNKGVMEAFKDIVQFSLSVVSDSAPSWTAACQVSLSINNTQNLQKFMSTELWCHATISSSVVPFSSRLQSFPASGSFPMSQFLTPGGQSIGVSALASILPMNTQDWFTLGWIAWTSLQSSSVQFSSVAQTCPTLCDPMNCSMPGLPVHHQLPEFTQIHVHRVSDAIQPSHPLSSLSPLAPNPSQHQSLFQWVNSSHEVAKVLEFQL